MIECLIKYYFSSDDRVVGFERPVKFPAVPFIGSHVSFSADHLYVEDVVFCEEKPPVLVITTHKFADSEAQNIIDDMKASGWQVMDDSTIGAKRT